MKLSHTFHLVAFIVSAVVYGFLVKILSMLDRQYLWDLNLMGLLATLICLYTAIILAMLRDWN